MLGIRSRRHRRLEANRISSKLTDDEPNALIAVTASVNSGVTAATARVVFGMLDQEHAAPCGDVCSPNPE